MRKSSRILSVLATAAIGAVSVAAFTGCTTKYPEVRFVYEFMGEEYTVDYVLTRKGAPRTVEHFLELVDAGYYNGTIIHSYEDDGFFLYGGAYVLGEDGDPVEKDYFSELRNLEQERGMTFSQHVYASGSSMTGFFDALGGEKYIVGGKEYTVSDKKIPTYTLFGEFGENSTDYSDVSKYRYSHTQGALAMAYEGGGSINSVYVDADGYQSDFENLPYSYNCATSAFYTFTSTGSRLDLDRTHVVFGKTKNYADLDRLITAVNDYANGLDDADEDGDGSAFTIEREFDIHRYDPIDAVRNAKLSATYNVPVEPIVIKSIKTLKY